MRKRNGLFIIIFLGSILLFIYYSNNFGNLSESKKNVDQSVLETKEAQMEMNQLVNKIISIGEQQSNPILKPYLEQLKTAQRELNEATNDFYIDPSSEKNYKKTMLKLEILRNELKIFR
jgi:hypothetical protein